MDSKELRIGNLVLVDSKITKIESIDDQGINSSVSGGYYPGETEIEYEARFGGKSFWSGYPEPTPIPITPEILIDCGFKLESKVWWKFHDNDISGWVLLDNSPVDESFSLCYDQIVLGIPLAKYLHQLQNIYFELTGNELTYTPLTQTIPSGSNTVQNTEE